MTDDRIDRPTSAFNTHGDVEACLSVVQAKAIWPISGWEPSCLHKVLHAQDRLGHVGHNTTLTQGDLLALLVKQDKLNKPVAVCGHALPGSVVDIHTKG